LNWAQLRPAVIKPVHESRSDIEIIFDLAKRLDLSKNFFDGDIEAAWNYQLEPSALSVAQLRETPIGLRSNARTRHQKHADIDTTGQRRGFDTPSRKIEIYSSTFAEVGYSPIPEFEHSPENSEAFPLTLTFFRDIHFSDEQHRNIPRL